VPNFHALTTSATDNTNLEARLMGPFLHAVCALGEVRSTEEHNQAKG